jgi:ATP-dependent Clp protease adaptor protein ClpS
MSDFTIVEPEPTTAEPTVDTRTRRQPPYAVVLHNDDVNGFDYVVGVLQKVFGYALQKAYQLTLQAHRSGRSIVWSGSLEVAELKADQIRSCGPDPVQASAGAQPLRVSVEELPQ